MESPITPASTGQDSPGRRRRRRRPTSSSPAAASTQAASTTPQAAKPATSTQPGTTQPAKSKAQKSAAAKDSKKSAAKRKDRSAKDRDAKAATPQAAKKKTLKKSSPKNATAKSGKKRSTEAAAPIDGATAASPVMSPQVEVARELHRPARAPRAPRKAASTEAPARPAAESSEKPAVATADTSSSPFGVLTGAVTINPRGFGFVTSKSGIDDAFISPQMVTRARLTDGDIVTAKIRTVDERSSVLRIVKIQRTRTRLFGVLVRNENNVELRVDPWLSSASWKVAGLAATSELDSLASVASGDAVVVEIDGKDCVKVLASFGPATEAKALWARSLERARVAEMAGPAKGNGSTKVTSLDRRDLTGLQTFTIDGPESRDLDDALSVERGEGGALTLYVHVADVAAKVPLDSSLDVRARRLGTSVYLPGHVVTMLDEQLSFDECSLLPGVVRDAMTVEMQVAANGQITSSEIYASTICSAAKLTYAQVAGLLTGKTGVELPAEIASHVELAHVVATRLGALRAARGGLRRVGEAGGTITFEANEVKLVGADGAEVAHDLIEECMVAANETVARWLVARGLSSVFRTHAAPGKEAADALEGLAAGLGITAVLGEVLTPMALSAFERQLEERGKADAGVFDVLMGKIGRASYRPEAGHHFGLASEAYVHFTSPIRRYADLTVHRIVKAVLAGESAKCGELAVLCAHLDEANEKASKAERVATTLLWLRWMVTNRPVGSATRGRIVRLATRGALVRLEGCAVSGWVKAPGSGPVHVDDEGLTLKRGQTSWKLGQALELTVTGLDLEAGAVELEVR